MRNQDNELGGYGLRGGAWTRADGKGNKGVGGERGGKKTRHLQYPDRGRGTCACKPKVAAGHQPGKERERPEPESPSGWGAKRLLEATPSPDR